MSIPQKTCSRCMQSKPTGDYYPDKRYKDGWCPWCSDCRREYRQARQADPVKRRQDSDRTLAWVKANPHEQTRRHQYDRERWKNPEQRQRKTEQDRERMRTPEKRARKNEQNRVRYRIRFQSDPEYRAYCRWNGIQRAHIRRQQIRANGGKLTRQQWRELCQQHNYCCAACGQKAKLTIDHIIPLSRGGKHSIENIQPLCLPCNQSKSANTVDYRLLSDDI